MSRQQTPDQSSRCFHLEQAPTFYPTEQEFKDPLRYIQSIKSHAQQFGICKIVPPTTFRPPFCLDMESFTFRTRFQTLNTMEGTARTSLNYMEKMDLFYSQQKVEFTIPVMGTHPVDLYRLQKVVKAYGGHLLVSKERKWAEIAREMGAEKRSSTRYAATLKQAYLRWIVPFEIYLGNQIEKSDVEVKSSDGEVSDPESDVDMLESVSSPENETSSRKRRAVEVSSEEESEGIALRPKRKRKKSIEEESDSDMESVRSGESTIANRSKLRRRRSSISLNEIKQVSLATLTKGKVYRQPSPTMKRLPRMKSSDISKLNPKVHLPKGNEVCVECNVKGTREEIVICDDCQAPRHLVCTIPKLNYCPESEWYCRECIKSHGDSFGFTEREEMRNLKDFRTYGDQFKRDWFQKHLGKEIVTEEECEREYWRLLRDPFADVEVEYGADVHSSLSGSGFPVQEKQPDNPYTNSPWNLNVLPLQPRSLFQNIRKDISGMMVPWVYVGMVFSTFCWHIEDHYTYSINYHHWGETKTWYGVPDTSADKLERVMKAQLPELFESNPDLLFHLTTILSPETLVENNVSVYALDQRPGEFVVTFPRAYHAGFNHGVNCAEAVNFAPADWLSFGESCAQLYSDFHKNPVFSHDELVVATSRKNMSVQTAIFLQASFSKMIEREMKQRSIVSEQGIPSTKVEPIQTTEDKDQCAECRAYCFLSCVVCEKHRDFVLCLNHYEKRVCDCRVPSLLMEIRYTIDDLHELKSQVDRVAENPIDLRDRLLKLARGDEKPTIEQYEELMTEFNGNEDVEIDALVELRETIADCKRWCESVQKIMTRRKGKGRQPNRSLERVQELMEELETLNFTAPEVISLSNAYKRALEIDARAKVLASSKEFDAAEIKALKDEAFDLCVDIDSLLELEYTSPEGVKFVEEHFGKKPVHLHTIDEIKEVREKAESMGLQNEPFFDDMTESISRAEGWVAAVEELLAAQSTDVEAARKLVTSSARWPRSPKHLVKLKAILDQYKIWRKRANAVLLRDSKYEKKEARLEAALNFPVDTKEDLQQLLADGLPYESREIQELRSAIKASEEWEKSMREFLVKESGVTLAQWLDDFDTSLQNIIGGGEMACFCNSRIESGTKVALFNQVVCTKCNQWYHQTCLKLDNVDHSNYQCPCCSVSLDYNPMDKRKYSDLKKLVIDTPVIGRPVEVRRLAELLIRLRAWTKKAKENLIHRPCSKYVWDTLHRLYSLPIVSSVALDFEKYQSEGTSAAEVCMCQAEFDPREPFYVCNSCQKIFHNKCVEATVVNRYNSVTTYRCVTCSTKSKSTRSSLVIGERDAGSSSPIGRQRKAKVRSEPYRRDLGSQRAYNESSSNSKGGSHSTYQITEASEARTNFPPPPLRKEHARMAPIRPGHDLHRHPPYPYYPPSPGYDPHYPPPVPYGPYGRPRHHYPPPSGSRPPNGSPSVYPAHHPHSRPYPPPTHPHHMYSHGPPPGDPRPAYPRNPPNASGSPYSYPSQTPPESYASPTDERPSRPKPQHYSGRHPDPRSHYADARSQGRGDPYRYPNDHDARGHPSLPHPPYSRSPQHSPNYPKPPPERQAYPPKQHPGNVPYRHYPPPPPRHEMKSAGPPEHEPRNTAYQRPPEHESRNTSYQRPPEYESRSTYQRPPEHESRNSPYQRPSEHDARNSSYQRPPEHESRNSTYQRPSEYSRSPPTPQQNSDRYSPDQPDRAERERPAPRLASIGHMIDSREEVKRSYDTEHPGVKRQKQERPNEPPRSERPYPYPPPPGYYPPPPYGYPYYSNSYPPPPQ